MCKYTKGDRQSDIESNTSGHSLNETDDDRDGDKEYMK